jgi:transcriptional pleiotropic regulator of transition state genes
MKATGIVRRIDDLGRVVIPKELRRTLGVEAGDPIEIYTNGNDVVLKKYHRGCYLCDSMGGDMIILYGHEICPKCVDKVSKYANKVKSALL